MYDHPLASATLRWHPCIFMTTTARLQRMRKPVVKKTPARAIRQRSCLDARTLELVAPRPRAQSRELVAPRPPSHRPAAAQDVVNCSCFLLHWFPLLFVALQCLPKDPPAPLGTIVCPLETKLASRLRNVHVSEAVCDGVIRASCDGLNVDVIVGQKAPTHLRGCLENDVLKERFGQRHHWSAVFFSVEHSKLKWPPSVREAIRLAKVWCKTVAFPNWPRDHQPRSFLVELMVGYVSGQHKSGWDNFRITTYNHV